MYYVLCYILYIVFTLEFCGYQKLRQMFYIQCYCFFVFIMDIEILQLVLWEYFKLETDLSDNCLTAKLLPN